MNENTTNNTQELSKKEKKAAYDRAHWEANKEKRTAQNKAYRERNKEKIKDCSKGYYLENKEKIKSNSKSRCEANKEKYNKTYCKAYYERNKEKILNRVKLYRKDHPEKTKSVGKKYYENNKNTLYEKSQQRIKSNPLMAGKKALRSCISNAFKRIKQNKPTNTQKLLGCTWEEAKVHFESLFQEGMTWENHGEWHIDHIRPVASFKEDELHLMNCISNLQPLWALDNFLKSDKY